MMHSNPSLLASIVLLVHLATVWGRELEEFGDHASLKGGVNTRSLQTATEDVSIWTQLRESLGLAIIGCLLICCMPMIIWRNEGRHVRELKRIDFCKNEAISVSCESPSEDTVGRLVHFVGTVKVGDGFPLEMKPGALNISSPVSSAIAIKRTCYIWQKIEYQSSSEKAMVGGKETRVYDVQEQWMTTPGPAHLQKTGATNSRGIWDKLVEASGEAPLDTAGDDERTARAKEMMAMLLATGPPHGVKASEHARVGDFLLSDDVIALISDEKLPVPNSSIPESVEGIPSLMKGTDNILRTFPEGSEPTNGDCKVVYEYAADGFECTFVVQQIAARGKDDVRFGVDQQDVTDKSIFGKCSGDLGTVWLVRKGHHDIEEMVQLARDDESKLHKIVRLVCFVLLTVGWVMLFSPLTTTLSTIPIVSQLGYFAVVLTAFIVSCTCWLTVMSLAYIAYRPVLMLGILAVSLGIWGIVIWRFDEAADDVTEEGS